MPELPLEESLDLAPFHARMQTLFPETLGMRLLFASPQLMVAELDVTRAVCTAPGVLHGGAIMAFADTLGALGTMAHLSSEQGTTTLESKTNFFRAGVEGTTVRGEARPLHLGRRTQVWQTQITNPDGKLVAQVIQTQFIL